MSRTTLSLSLGAVLCGAAFAATGCGGGGTAAVFHVSNGGSTTSGGIVLTTRSAVVQTDVDGDGLSDLVSLGRDGTGTGPCLRNAGGAGYVDAPAAWKDAPAVAAVADDCATRGDADLADGLGAHVAPGRTPRGAPYALVHLGDGARDVAGPPALEALEPSSGPVRALLLVLGHGLAQPDEAPAVSIGGAAATVLYAFRDAVLVVVPEGLSPGAADVRVTRGGLESGALPFTVTEAPIPVVAGTLPSRVEAGGRAVIRGEHLGGPLDTVGVSFAGVASANVLSLRRALVVDVPAGAVSGSLVVTVNGRASEPYFVEVGAAPAPAIEALVPAAASPGSLVRIEGTDLLRLGTRASVRFGGVEAAIFGVGDGSVTAIVPSGAADGDVVVTTGGLASAGVPFDVTARGNPVVTSLSPDAATGGELVRIEGRDLVDLSGWRPGRLPPLPLFGDLRVTVGGADAWFVLPGAEGLDVVVPRGAATGAVVVTVNGRASAPVPFTRN